LEWQRHATTHGWDRISWTIFLNWPQTSVLLISVFQATRIIGVSHWCLELILVFIVLWQSWILKYFSF
jgi:hypothetical protein